MNFRHPLATILLATGATCFAVPRPDLVARVASGELKEARASWWGFDAADATAILQAAIDSRVPRLVVDRMDAPWTVTPLHGVSNQELVLEPGTEILAKAGAFRPIGASLLTWSSCSNVTVTGYGATMRMRHADYMKPPYAKSEWRHALVFLCCRNVLVRGLTLASSGGDGIYLGSNNRPPFRNIDVVVRDVLCHDNHRQGISVITAENLLIENTVMRETHGTPPAAGIDFEPNHPCEVLKNCTMRNCLSVNNEGHGFTTWVGQLAASSEPVDLRFENCTAFGNRVSFGIAIDSRRGRDVDGHVALRGCRFEKPRGPRAVDLRENRDGTFAYDIEDCVIVQTNAAGAEVSTPMGENWKKINLPLQGCAKDTPPRVVRPDLAHAHVIDAAPGSTVRLAPLRVRHQADYLVYAASTRTLHFEGRQFPVGRYPASTKPIVVSSAAGKPVAKIPLPGFKACPLTFDAPAPGFYRMSVELGAGAFALTSADAPVALDLTERAQGLISSVGSLWFAVPVGARRLAFFASGEGAERVHARLVSPQGVCLWDQDNISNWTRATIEPALPGLWRIDIARPSQDFFEDTRLDLAGVPAFLFLNPDKTWTCPPENMP